MNNFNPEHWGDEATAILAANMDGPPSTPESSEAFYKKRDADRLEYWRKWQDSEFRKQETESANSPELP